MEITRVETVPYGIPVEGFSDAYTAFSRSDAVLVRIHTDTGHVGVGEACAWEPEFYGETIESVTANLENYAAPAIEGEDPRQIGHVLREVDRRLARNTCVKEGIDLALHDLVGKLLDVPAHTLLGGAYRDHVRVAAEVGLGSPSEMADEALAVLEQGFEVLKLKGSSDPDLDVERIRAVREAVGEAVPLRLDPNAAWNAVATVDVLDRVADCSLQYVEQPVPTDDLEGLAHVRRTVDVPVMADESAWTPGEVVRLREYDAADLLNLKIAKTCGLHQGNRMSAVGAAQEMPCIAGTELEPGVSAAAKLHLAAAMRDHPFASEFTELAQVEGSILRDPLEVADGVLAVPDDPGLGVTIDETALSEYALDVSV